jgi:hypothetical protein
MAQAVSRRPLCRGLGSNPGQSAWDLWWTKWHCGRTFPSYTVALRAYVSSGGWKVGPLVAAVQRHSLTPLTCATALQKVEFYNAAFRVYSMVLKTQEQI